MPRVHPVEVYTLTSDKAEVKIVTYGARLISIRVPNRNGVMGNVILGHDKLQDYKTAMNHWMGATIGRYANRIDRGQFTLDGNLPDPHEPAQLRSAWRP